MTTPDTLTTSEATSSPLANAGTIVTATESRTIKSGWQTTEYWLSKIAMILGGLLAGGFIADGSREMRIAGIACVVLSSLGYTVSRGMAKSGAAVLLLALCVAPASSACGGQLGDRATAGGRAFIDCAKPEIKSTVRELAPVFLSLVRDSLASDGKIDRGQLGSFAAPLKSAGTRCALDAAIGMILRPPAPLPGAPMSSPLQADEDDIVAAYANVRRDLWEGVEVRSANPL